MRNLRRFGWGSMAAIAAMASSGCIFSSTFCEAHPDHCMAAAGGSGGQGGATTGTMTGSSSTGIMPGCVPSLTDAPVGDACGVFVDLVNGNDANAGTMASPKKTLGEGVGAWTAGQGIYVCDGALSDTSGVTLPAGAIVYGGLDCAGGYKVKADDARTELAPAAGAIPLTLADGAGTTEIHRLKITGTAAAAPDSSAIGVVIGSVAADLEDVDVITGDAVNGASSSTPTDDIGPSNPDDPSIKGNAGASANTTTPTVKNPGGPAKVNPLCTATGGSGGDGGEIAGTPQAGGSGNPGSATPTPTMGANDGLGGAGDMGGGCTSGHDGRNGDPVPDGDGANGPTSLGSVAVDGYHGVPGGAGGDGNPGQGGGGGGGAKGKTGPDTRGASGASGGAGGCGGKGAGGGRAGGSSIGIIVLGAAPTLTNVTIAVGKGGDGGAGAAGEFGATGGNGGAKGLGISGTLNACAGGAGGQGSNGGAGGGGHGGHSIGIAYVTSAPSGGFTVSKQVGGAGGGTAGSGAPAENGVSADTQQLNGS